MNNEELCTFKFINQAEIDRNFAKIIIKEEIDELFRSMINNTKKKKEIKNLETKIECIKNLQKAIKD